MTAHSALPLRTIASAQVSTIGLGCMSLSSVYGASDDAAGIELIRTALDRGVTMVDTSDMYGWGHNEKLVGAAIAGRRSEVFLATKFGNLGGRDGKVADGRPEYVISSCEASLKRLNVETIDLYYQHRIDPTVPIEETVGAMASLVKGGNHPPRPLRSPDRRGPERVLAPVPDRGRGNPAHDPGTRHRLRRLLAARARPPDRQGRGRGDPRRQRRQKAPSALRGR